MIVDGDVESVNGNIGFGVGSEISGEVSTVNGSILLNQTVTQSDVHTVSGNIELRDKSIVKGNIVVGDTIGNVETGGKSGDIVVSEKMSVIVIGDKKSVSAIEIRVTGGSIIEGDIMVEREVEVRLILSDGGKVLGQVNGVEVIEETVLDDD